MAPAEDNSIKENKNNSEINQQYIIAPLFLISTIRTGNIIQAIYQNSITMEYISYYFPVLKVDNPRLNHEIKYFYHPLKENPSGFR